VVKIPKLNNISAAHIRFDSKVQDGGRGKNHEWLHQLPALRRLEPDLPIPSFVIAWQFPVLDPFFFDRNLQSWAYFNTSNRKKANA
jgi:hypothetical protein